MLKDNSFNQSQISNLYISWDRNEKEFTKMMRVLKLNSICMEDKYLNKKLTLKYNVTQIPTLILVDKYGQRISSNLIE